jgi:hypothetical protein
MKYPTYDDKDLKFAQHDGNYPVSEFASFLSQLIDKDVLENDTEKGIVSFVNSKGTKSLSDKQAKVLDIIVSRYNNKECKVCGETIPLSEVLDLDDNDGLCNYHKHQFDKDKD